MAMGLDPAREMHGHSLSEIYKRAARVRTGTSSCRTQQQGAGDQRTKRVDRPCRTIQTCLIIYETNVDRCHLRPTAGLGSVSALASRDGHSLYMVKLSKKPLLRPRLMTDRQAQAPCRPDRRIRQNHLGPSRPASSRGVRPSTPPQMGHKRGEPS